MGRRTRATSSPSEDSKPSTTESELEQKLKAACEKRRWLCFKLDARGNAGVPDRVIAADRGVVVFVELKTDVGVEAAIQSFTHRQLVAREHRVVTVYGHAGILAALDSIEQLVDTSE